MRDHVDAEEEEERAEESADEDEKDDDDADAEGEQDEDEDAEQSPKGRKRARINDEGDSRPTDGGPKAEKRGQTLPRDVDGFIPGSIVRIQLRNFLTYDWVEFRPGPYLNMIFGPNGTGKSSIACAICLGLNFPPALLNRAPELKSYVKNDKKDGHIEIELKGAKGKPNLVIRRLLSSSSKIAPFVLNGKSASGKEINARMAELNVQVNNLCAFLPQDRVAEFARMSPQQLLRETQRAAGNENLTSWHDTLISSGKELRTIQDAVNADREQLKTMEDRNANLERDVRRYEERRALEKKIQLLELIVPFKEYYEARDVYRQLKPQRTEAVRNVRRLEARNKPFICLRRTMEAEAKEREKVRDEKKNAVRRKLQAMSSKWEEVNGLDLEAEELKNKLDSLKKTEKERGNQIKRTERTIEELKEKLAHPPETENLEDIQNEIKALNIENNNTHQRLQELQEKQRANIEKGSNHHVRVTNEWSCRLQQLDSVSHQKLEMLRRFDPDCAEVVEWLRKNQNRFRMEIFEPAMLCVTVPNRAYVDAVEACFGGPQLRTIVAQCEEDYQLLNRLCVDTPEAIGRKARINTWFKPADHSRLPPPPASAEQLRALGFDGYAIDFIDCPEGLRWFLCSDVRLHRTAIALRPQSVDPNRAMEMAAHAGGVSYVIGRVMNQVTRSRYGKRLPQNATREIQQARSLAHATGMDPVAEVKRELQMKLADAQTNMRTVQQEEQELSAEDKEIQAAGREYKAAHVGSVCFPWVCIVHSDIVQDKLEARKQQHEKKLVRLRDAPPADVERNRIKQQLLTITSKRVNCIRAYVDLMHAAIKEQEAAARAGLEFLQISANKAALEAMCKDQAEAIAKAHDVAVDIVERFKQAKAISQQKLEVSKEKLAEAEVEQCDKFKEMEEVRPLHTSRSDYGTHLVFQAGELVAKSTDEWRADLDQGREELEMNMATNANVVEQYNKRKAEIDVLSAKIEGLDQRMKKIEQGIKMARDNWQPELEKLVGSIGKKFSAAFDRIGCAGEIRIREDEDYEKWAIDIMVKFRDNEKLQLLTGERQSGGERSLTTILYLMSLTEEARAPFSLVDEINQGMDQRAERAVHNSLVEVTCQEDSGQYFLITPKLLPDLNYHERMKILCVNNGEWLPEEKGMGNLNGLIDNFLRFRQNRGTASS
ncbi:P-loop containing nucleoside triphosphate hydrolase protein [Lentinus tigrinus ALCF2SS1-7]|uniref:Structural maintenance of chromosomes protein 5 n=1 Tax=Lentinus tigrinus ALCF2SS1-6 TaxID=1328759 RepID=A0A5C2SV20_9APHY|nr:P-loop containing nucleoside triphosphate hydrolase protein [Lentinus tigrinus ALCF2SS1-6]RPD81397.1 P-loop containing nucleoside triphosphate hydrolase protein [Lentinus tigrinus ALCF2SS1-7]